MAGLPPVSPRPVGVLLQVCRHVQPEAPTCVCMSWPYQAGHMQPSQAAIPKPLLAHPAHKPQQVLKVVSQQLGLETQLTAEHLLYLFLMHSKIKQLCKFFFSLFLGEKVRKKKKVFPMGSVSSTEKEALFSKKRCCQLEPCLPQPGRPGLQQVELPQSRESVEEIRCQVLRGTCSHEFTWPPGLLRWTRSMPSLRSSAWASWPEARAFVHSEPQPASDIPES